jgi:DNA polymerase I-like protein with 3'-5' exonuclease and polymerase domains
VPHLSWAGGVRCPYCPYPAHDEIIVEARDGIEDQVEAIVKECMERGFEKIIPEVPFVVEPKIADSWG